MKEELTIFQDLALLDLKSKSNTFVLIIDR